MTKAQTAWLLLTMALVAVVLGNPAPSAVVGALMLFAMDYDERATHQTREDGDG